MLTYIDIERIKVKHYDPANPMSRLVYKDPNVCIRFDFAIVDNNADPDKRGRIKVRFPLIRPYASPKQESGSSLMWAPRLSSVFSMTARPVLLSSVRSTLPGHYRLFQITKERFTLLTLQLEVNEVKHSSGTVANVKINDKEAAVPGSMVKTCKILSGDFQK
ncbi:MAG: hypothetical protein JXJ04_21035 [Spirochaetales bacterium]|nr:hypothetical protein [Spirochaetales bacterium]